MNPSPFLFRDFVRALGTLECALAEGADAYLLLSAESGCGKTALLRALGAKLDRCRHRIAYFSQARLLRAMGFVRVLAHTLHVPCRRTHPETTRELVRLLEEEPQRLLVWFDDAGELPQETLGEARSLVEANLGGPSQVTVLFSGLPDLRERLQAIPSMWRRIVVREQLTGLMADEIRPLLEHHFQKPNANRLCDEGARHLFQQGRGLPGRILPMFRTLISKSQGKARIEPDHIDQVLTAWDLP